MSSHPLQWLFELQEPQLNRIAGILAQAQHTLLMAVHPWFPEFDSALRITDRDADRVSPQHRTTVGEIRRRRPDYLAELAKTLAELAPPVGILLEEHDRCAHSWSRLPHSGLNRDWLVVPTIEASPTPRIESVKTAQAPHEDQVRAWEILGEKLRRLGVRRVLLCGAYCSFHPAARQCVDGTSLALQVYCGFKDVRVLSGPTLMLGEPGSVTIVTITEEGAAC